MRVKCCAQEHNALSQPVLKPRPPYPESSVLTIRPPCLPMCTDAVPQSLSLDQISHKHWKTCLEEVGDYLLWESRQF